MNPPELLYVAGVWEAYFPREVFIAQDPRLAGIGIFRDFFSSGEGRHMISLEQLATQKYVYFDVRELNERLPFSDFELSLKMRPTEVTGFVGIALSLLAKAQNPHYDEHFIIYPRFYGLSEETSFGNINSSTVGQLVSMCGHVVRVSPCRPLVLSASFLCAKCMKYTFSRLEDGIFIPPAICSTEKCYNKFLEIDRSTVTTGDYQRVKITELDEVNQRELLAAQQRAGQGHGDSTAAAAALAAASAARVPRTLEVEVRDTLVNTCVPGDLLCVVGVVKAAQLDAPRSGGGKGGGGYKESGLHVLYLLANSLVCLKGSGDRGERPGTGRAISGLSRSAGLTAPEVVVLDGAEDPTAALSQPCPPPPATPQLHRPLGDGSHGGGGSRRETAFTPEELAIIRALALSEQAFPLLVHSLCPTIYGHELVKAGILLGLFGGSSNKAQSGGQGADSAVTAEVPADEEWTPSAKDFKVRPDIHVLVVGDPGLGKSQMLRAAATVAPRAVFVTGNTSTAAGLTVSISRDSTGGGKGGGDLCIEAGALVLADQGVCCIDELDKITAEQHALLEAMEQQSISIAKSGVVTSLKSRTSVLAAANPAGGHYNRKKSVCENLKMNAALLSRFDLIFILLDRPDESHDRLISEHIMQSHSAGPGSNSSSVSGGKRGRESWEAEGVMGATQGPEDTASFTLQQRLRWKVQEALRSAACTSWRRSPGVSPVDARGVVRVEVMRRYIEYAKQYVHPHLTPGAAKVLQRLYLTMRSEASAGQSIPVTTRHLESLIRLAQARARVDLREEVTTEDAQDVVQLLQESLLDVYTSENGAIDAGRKGGISLAKQVKALVKVMTRESTVRGSSMFSRQEIATLCQRLALDKEVDALIDVMRTECYLLLKGPRMYQLQTA